MCINKDLIMKYYELDTVFTFGKYKGKSIGEVLEINSLYINWCITKLDHFYIANDTIQVLSEESESFSISQEERTILDEKLKVFQEQCDEKAEQRSKYEESKPSYGRYSGSYAQDEMGYSDDVIDSAFDGDPDMYWNID